MDFMTMTIHPLPLLPPSYPHRLIFHLKGRMGKRQARRTSFISENHRVELDLKYYICSFVCVLCAFSSILLMGRSIMKKEKLERE